MSLQQHFDRCPICETGVIGYYGEPRACDNGCNGRVDDSDTELIAQLFRLGKRFPQGRTLAQLAYQATDSIFKGAVIWKTGQDQLGWFWAFHLPERINPFKGSDVTFWLHENGDGYLIVEQVYDNWLIEQDGNTSLVEDPPHRPTRTESTIVRKHLRLVR